MLGAANGNLFFHEHLVCIKSCVALIMTRLCSSAVNNLTHSCFFIFTHGQGLESLICRLHANLVVHQNHVFGIKFSRHGGTTRFYIRRLKFETKKKRFLGNQFEIRFVASTRSVKQVYSLETASYPDGNIKQIASRLLI